jgi:hypothetical protein
MKLALIPAALLALAAVTPAYAAETKNQVTEVGKPHMEFACAPKHKLRLYVRSGEVRIVGTDAEKISVDLSGKNADKIADVKAQLTCKDNLAELHVSGGPKDELRITIHVPKNLDLYARVPAGEVTIEQIAGNKDVELHAGELTIYVGKASDYGRVEASVYAGEVDAEIFGDSKDGLFRTFSKDASGQYRLHAHVGAGQLTLRE